MVYVFKRMAGRPTKPDSKKVVKKPTSYSRKNFDYVLEIINERKWSLKGSFSKVINEIIADHEKVRRFKELEKAKLEEKLEGLK